MATAKVKQFWTAFISVLFALLASVGLAGTAAATQQPAVQQPEEPAGHGRRYRPRRRGACRSRLRTGTAGASVAGRR